MNHTAVYIDPKVRDRYLRHVKKWESCHRCHLGKEATSKAIVRGCLPCDYLFIGEAPGAAEDLYGLPFVGPAGQLLQSIISDSVIDEGYTYAVTNVIACIPRSGNGGVREPTAASDRDWETV